MFETAPLNPPDAIFGLMEEFKKDSNPDKINLTVGVYRDESGTTPVMKAVRQAEQILLDAAGTKGYLPIDGSAEYNAAVGKLILGESSNAHIATAQTPGGTVSLRVAGELVKRVFNVDTIWMSNPTWANHPQIYTAAGLNLKKYEYLNDAGTGLGFEKVLASLADAKAGEAILLHTVCHNPTGVDPTPDQWKELLTLVADKKLIPIFDFAYQGFGESLEADAFPIRHFIEVGQRRDRLQFVFEKLWPLRRTSRWNLRDYVSRPTLPMRCVARSSPRFARCTPIRRCTVEQLCKRF